MKKLIISLIMVTTLILSGCSFLQEANDSLNYATETTEYINELSTFAEEAPNLEGQELKSRLESLKGTVKDFMEIEPPSMAEDIHKELENKSQVLLDATNKILQDGEVTIEQLKQSEIYKTIDNITKLKKQIEDLGL
ncbi:DUF6376 family protein [Virgibacillus litoralis]|uniref:Lipoprotein n=1 Tax=Virgibacillus litoralis TaxID=578221 RepID=A0ABS4HFT5_9BACI|nr:DUF6376 family protein [Virgibacillus litoralis]MBP1949703.1 hypothetical protein [Virgibacillus litoralis]